MHTLINSFTDSLGALLGMCNPLLDISAEVGTELLTKYNVSLNNAILAADEHLPLYQEMVEKYPVQYIVCPLILLIHALINFTSLKH